MKDKLKITNIGKGYIGEGEFKTNDINHKPTKEYKTWNSMLRRCYSEKYHLEKPTYKDCEVHPDWCNFQKFAKWFDENYIDGWELDKDILIKGNKIYGQDSCCFVPSSVNLLLNKRNSKRGQYPIGVSYCKKSNKYKSQINIDSKVTYLGCFDTPEEAFNAYKEAKEKEIKRIANEWKDKINPKVYDAMIKYEVQIND